MSDLDKQLEKEYHDTKTFDKKRLGSILLMALLLVSIVAVFITLNAYLHSIILGALFSSIFYPVHRRIKIKLKKRHNLAALLTTTLVALLVIGPILTFSSMLVVRGINTYNQVDTWVKGKEFAIILARLNVDNINKHKAGEEVIVPIIIKDNDGEIIEESEEKISYDDRFGKLIITTFEYKKYLPDDFDPNKEIKNLASNILTFLGDKVVSSLKAATSLSVNFILMLFIMFYFFKDGPQIGKYVLSVSPLSPRDEQLLIERVRSVSRSAVVGTLATAVIQAILGMIGFAISGIPWFFWGFILGFASLIPVVGTALVWVPCCIYLAITGHYAMAIFLAAWCIIVVGMADNFVRPYFMKGDTGMSSVIAFFSILGGMNIFGLLGVIYGPLIFGVCAILLYIYKLETDASNKRLQAESEGPLLAATASESEIPTQE